MKTSSDSVGLRGDVTLFVSVCVSELSEGWWLATFAERVKLPRSCEW